MWNTNSLFIAGLFSIFTVTISSGNVATFYLSKLCPSTPGGRAYLSLGTVTESLNSTALIVATPQPEQPLGYDYGINCTLIVSGPPGHHIVASVRRVQFRGHCVDRLTIYADNQSYVFCGLQYDEYETYSITTQRMMTVEFISGPDTQGFNYASTGFQLTVTAFRDAPCNKRTEFTCENDRCIAAELNCSGHNHCGDNSNQQCAPVTHTPSSCSSKEYTCANGNCIPSSSLCDGFDDCGDLSDEMQCSDICSPWKFVCKNGNCLDTFYVCDGVNNCGDSSDEENCENCSHLEFKCRNGKCVSSSTVCNRHNDCGDWSDEEPCKYTCSPDELTCRNGHCVNSKRICNRENDCGDWSDEDNCIYTCSPSDFTCRNGNCTRSRYVCDKMNDCGDWSDEENCTYTCSPSDFTCSNGNCTRSRYVCDKMNDCGDWSDEENCTDSPALIIGLSVTATGVALVGIIICIILYKRKKRNKSHQ